MRNAIRDLLGGDFLNRELAPFLFDLASFLAMAAFLAVAIFHLAAFAA